jgi:hypothetical protein
MDVGLRQARSLFGTPPITVIPVGYYLTRHHGYAPKVQIASAVRGTRRALLIHDLIHRRDCGLCGLTVPYVDKDSSEHSFGTRGMHQIAT